MTSSQKTRTERLANYYHRFRPGLGICDDSGESLRVAYERICEQFDESNLPSLILVDSTGGLAYHAQFNTIVASTYSIAAMSVLMTAQSKGPTSDDLRRIVFELAIPPMIENGFGDVALMLAHAVEELPEFSWDQDTQSFPANAFDGMLAEFAIGHEIGHWCCESGREDGALVRGLAAKASFLSSVMSLAPVTENLEVLRAHLNDEGLLEECLCDSIALDLVVSLHSTRIPIGVVALVAFSFVSIIYLEDVVTMFCHDSGQQKKQEMLTCCTLRLLHMRYHLLQVVNDSKGEKAYRQIFNTTHEQYLTFSNGFVSRLNPAIREVFLATLSSDNGTQGRVNYRHEVSRILKEHGRLVRQNWREYFN